MVKDFNGIEELVKSRCKSPKRVMVIGNCFARGMMALRKAADTGLIKPVLLGNEKSIRENAEFSKIDISDFEIHHKVGSIVGTALEMLESPGEIDVFVRGDVGILDMMSAFVQRDSGFRVGKNLITGVSAHFVGSLGRLLFLSDPIVIPEPNLQQKIAIVENAVRFVCGLGFVKPKVGLTAAVEAVYEVMKHTTEAAIIAKMSERGQIKDCLVDGPLSMDTAVIESAAKGKGVSGWVAGRADILVQPSIEVSYGMYKAFVYFVKANSGSVVVGGKVPLCVTSRADSVQTNYNSLMMALA